jgi:hypothetical protein
MAATYGLMWVLTTGRTRPSLQPGPQGRNYWPVWIIPEALAFGAKAQDYEKGRPEYPSPAVGWLVEALRIDSRSTVIDLAAGTGKLARALLVTGAHVIAVEPVEGMRKVLSSVVPEAEVLGHR